MLRKLWEIFLEWKHVPDEYEDAPEWTDAQIAEADLYEGGRLIRRGRSVS